MKKLKIFPEPYTYSQTFLKKGKFIDLVRNTLEFLSYYHI